jgi:hypothetical protein
LIVRIDKTYGLIGALFFLSIPIIVKLSISVYVDLGLIFFTTVSLILVFTWKDSGFRLKYLILSGICCGLAMGTKYNGLITFFILTLIVPYLQSKYGENEKGRVMDILFSTGVFILTALVLFSPWMVRNLLWTGNPIFPLYNSFFSQGNQVQTVTGQGFDPFTTRRILFNESWWDMALVPLRIFFQGQDGSPQYFDGRLNPFLLFFTFCAFLSGKKNVNREMQEKRVLLSFSLLFFAVAFFSTVIRIRYISPIIPPLVILSVFGIRNMMHMAGGFNRRAPRILATGSICVMVLYLFLLNGVYMYDQFRKVDPFSYLTGHLTRDEYIEKFRPEYGAIKYINQNLPDDSRVLLLFVGKRGYYLDRDYLAGINIIKEVTEGTASEKDILADLRNRGITHFLIRHKLFVMWVNNNLTREKKAVLEELFKNGIKLIYRKYGYGLYELSVN